MVEMLDAQGVEVATMRAAVRSEDNRERILAAARSEFAQQGFRGATLRAIAGEVGVDVALIAHYFGNKRGLDTEAMTMPDRAHRVVAAALTAPAEQTGEVLARGYLSLWGDPETGAAIARHIVEAPSLTCLDFEDFVRRSAVAAQAHLDIPDQDG